MNANILYMAWHTNKDKNRCILSTGSNARSLVQV